MSLHKLTAGDGYTYLTRQVAAHDATSRGFESLGDYYEQKGESPGLWMGRGLVGLSQQFSGGRVTEAQMRALWGEGRHPDAEAIEARLRAEGRDDREIRAATRLGARFPVHPGSTQFRTATAAPFAAYNRGLGLPGDSPVPAEVRARIRTSIAEELFVEEYGRAPADDRERAGFLARISRQATTAVAGYDLTFSPVKSVSALWAIAPQEIAEQVEAAHHAAVADVLTWLEDHAAFTRLGAQAVAQVDVIGLLAAAFTHRDSRAGDPDLHTHVAISNKVQTLDGRWQALDGRPLHAATVAASERYNTRLEAEMVARLGVRFADRADTEPGRRPVREIVGIDPRLLTAWSRRRQAIDVRRGELAAAFQTAHGRPPTPVEALHLAQQATLETRDRKHEPRSLAEQRAGWRAEAEAILGPAGVASMVAAACTSRRPVPPWADFPDGHQQWVEQAAACVVATVQVTRATWQVAHVRAEAERVARRAAVPLDDLGPAVDAVVERALSEEHSILLTHHQEWLPGTTGVPIVEPAELRRRDGSSYFELAGTHRYTSAAIVAAERALVEVAGRRDGRMAPAAVVDVALLESEANGLRLNPGQVDLVRQLAGSGARLQLGLAPAGTGKTTAMRVLARAWLDSGGHVLGLAPSAAAAAVLRDELGATTETLAKLRHVIDHPSDGVLPEWVRAIGPDTLVVVDEAGMAGTGELAQVVEFVVGRGGSVRLIGDDQQLAAIGAGGVLRDIAEVHGAVSLTDVVRFADPAEGAASLALRDGDPTAIAFYTDQGRVQVGDLTTCVEQAYEAWAAARATGQDALMLAFTRDLVTELNARARADRLAAEGASGGVEVFLADGCRASVGDTVITRENDRRLRISGSDWVKNGDRWLVTGVTAAGGLQVRHLQADCQIVLPATYVAEHVALGYASTVHGAQGITADVAHLIASGQEYRQALYVAMTRGRFANHVHLAVAGDGDPHSIIERDSLLPPTAVDVLTRILTRDGAQVSATTQARRLADPAARLQAAADRYQHSLATAAHRAIGPDGLTELDTIAEQVLPGLTDEAAWPTLRDHLALHAVAGQDPAAVLTDAVTARELDTAQDLAAVLDWRLDPTQLRSTATGPLPWLPGIPAALLEPTSSTSTEDDLAWAGYLRSRADLTAATAAEIVDTVRAWTADTAPAWAQPFLTEPLPTGQPPTGQLPTGQIPAGPTGTDPGVAAVLTDLAVWRAATGVPDGDQRPTGPAQQTAVRARHQRRLDERVAAALRTRATSRWTSLAHSIDPRLLKDPHWPTIAARLTTAADAGVDVTGLAAAVARHHPLPDEQPAAALWWRLRRHQPTTQVPTTNDPDDGSAVKPAIGQDTSPATEPDSPDDEVEVSPTAGSTTTAPDPAMPVVVSPTVSSLEDLGHDDPASDPASDPVYDEVDARGRERLIAIASRPILPLDPVDTEPARAAAPDPAAARMRELNQIAHDFYRSQYPSSWAPGYLRSRLGTDIHDDDRFAPGHAPAGWTSLVTVLRRAGAKDDEILAAGLGSRSAIGQIIDRFRDRLVLPIRDEHGIVGFVARRNPAHDAEASSGAGERHGPKYLNTPQTSIYSKGEHLYGLTEAAPALAAGAAPVLVEGPLDAIAVTLAGGGRHLGIAALGTALTPVQADLLREHTAPGQRVIVATDPDTAGRTAAARAYTLLTERKIQPDHLDLPDGTDPAQLYADDPDALRANLETAGTLCAALVEDLLTQWAPRLDEITMKVFVAREAASLIAWLPHDQIQAAADAIAARLDVFNTTVYLGIVDAWEQREDQQTTEPRPERRRPHPVQQPQPTRRPTADDLPPPPRLVSATAHHTR